MLHTKRFGWTAAAVLLATQCWAAEPPPQVHVAAGALNGFRRGSVEAFLGVPYAAPPVGADRWRSPQPVRSWRGTRVADHFGASCVQPPMPQGFGPWTHEYVHTGPIGEDCLYLNVWTPVRAGRAMPVLVWIYGGAFIGGSASVPIYDGARLAAHGIVVVSFNYRLGALGFFAHPALAAEAAKAHEPPGNYGLQDMIAALRWVHRNIAAFGGDPSAVTIAGQSAGAISVHDLLVSPLAAGVFERAIAESGLPTTAPVPSLSSAEQTGEAMARRWHARTAGELRALPVGALLPAGSPMSGPRWEPIVDGQVLPAPPARLLGAGKSDDVPILIGITADERSATDPVSKRLTVPAWRAFLRASFGAMAPQFAKIYPANSDSERARAMRSLERDLGLGALYQWSRARFAHARQPVFGYLWNHAEPGPDSSRWGAFHSSEIPYVFATFDASPEREFGAIDNRISRRVARYWVDFVKTGNPNGPGLPAWPSLRRHRGEIMELGARMRPRRILPPRTLRVMREFISRGGRTGLF